MGRWSTIPEQPDMGRARRNRWARRAFLTALAAFLLAGALNVFGVRSGDVTASAGGYTVTVHHAESARPGLAVPWSVTIGRDEPFAAEETLRVRALSRYFELFDENGFEPEPERETTDGRYTYWEFATPEGGRELTISLDTRMEPAEQRGRPGAIAVLDEAGDALVEVHFRTKVWP